MKVTSAEFITSSTLLSQCPTPDRLEVAFIGRSNVGKSSLINMLVGQKKLAKVSGTPGKTQVINHFLINKEWYLVDLPGYGYAKVSQNQRVKWGQMINSYLTQRETLACTFVLVDARHEPQASDLDMINWLGENQLPQAIVLTKADKVSKNKVQSHVARYRRALKEYWEEIPPFLLTSSSTGEGRDELLHFIDALNN